MGDLKVPDNLSSIMRDRYYQDNEDNIQQVFNRVAKFVAGGEEQYGWSDEDIKELQNQYYDMMNSNLFIPSSPFLMNSGTKLPMVFACFLVGGIDDDLGAIYKGIARQGMINKQGGKLI